MANPTDGKHYGDPRKQEEYENSQVKPHAGKPAVKMSPSWWAPVFVTLALIGLVWLIVYYLTGAQYPIPGIVHWNMAIALGFMMAAFGMVLYWR